MSVKVKLSKQGDKMRTKQFKSESKKLMDMMINSIYTHKEIFLRELISNASDALDKLYFRSLTDNSVGIAPDDFEIRLEIDKDARTLKVIDNGCGMTEDVQKHIFEKFYQGDTAHATEGNGLGLSLAKRIVDLCKGKITVESSPGNGTCFYVYLPIEAEEAAL